MTLIDSMTYSLESGGKRLRPLLCIASTEYLGGNPDSVMPAACAIEYIHTYSLIHDDLPAMDDDDVRRGKPSSHRRYTEPVALLTGDSLLTEAFGQMALLREEKAFTSDRILDGFELLVHHSGIRGMVGGQLLDVTSAESALTLPELEFIHIHKTGAMILMSVLMPAKLMGAPPETVQRLRRYGEAVGLAFQISDDLLDSEQAFRYARGPRKKPKPSYVHLMSPAETRDKLNRLIDSAVSGVKNDGARAEPLVRIAEFIRSRKA
ncbi:MAG: polyprenyl synthetase family protein [Deltaproteobacteria bacterium]|nr:polyprenyl synthetase family protein [Deltaproteobacteria bacterium]